MRLFRFLLSGSWSRLISTFLFLLILRGGTAINANVELEQANLPKTVGAWTRPDVPRRILPDRIFDYMDGAGELYLAYRFHHLDVYRYEAPGREEILVELYWMDSSDDAFGLLSGDWGGDVVDLGQRRRRGARADGIPDRRALYGAGLLRIWSDSLYARVMAYRETEESKGAVIKIGRAITAGRRNPRPPQLLSALPKSPHPDFRFRDDRVCYFRSYLVLNSVYFLSTANILNLGPAAEAVVASYAPARPGKNLKSAQLILIRYADAAAAGKAIARFEEAYLPEKGKSPQKQTSEDRRLWQVEDGWLGFSQSGRTAVLVFECGNRESAALFLKEAIKQLNALEDTHG